MRNNWMKIIFKILEKITGINILVIAVISMPSLAFAENSAVILQYHRFGVSELPTTSVTIKQFESHIRHLQDGDYTILPVPHIIAALRANQPLPDRTIGITIDDAGRSVIKEAWPRLEKAGFPFTLFVSTDAVDQNNARTMSWDEVRTLMNSGVTIGNHSSSHEQLWVANGIDPKQDILNAQERFKSELGFMPLLFAYPYGEYNSEIRLLTEQLGFEAAFGQNSGVINNNSDYYTLSRFSLNEAYGDIKRFQLIVDTLPISVTDITPSDPIVKINPPHIGFTLKKNLENIDNIACYASNQGAVKVELLGTNRVELRLSKALVPGRTRVNCTLPGPDNRWRWLGMQFIVP